MSSAEFLKRIGLKPHVATPASPTTPAQPVTQPAAPPKAAEPSRDSGKPSLSFKLGGTGIPAGPASTGSTGTQVSVVNPVVPANLPAPSQGTIPAAQSAVSPEAIASQLALPPTAESFQALLDQFDLMVGKAAEVTQLEISYVRNHVARIMTDLKTYPEFDGFLIDRDVHNVMKFVQASSRQADHNFVTSAERKQKKSDSAAKAAAADLSAFDFGGNADARLADLKAKRPAAASAPMQLTDLGKLNIDAIPAKDKR